MTSIPSIGSSFRPSSEGAPAAGSVSRALGDRVVDRLRAVQRGASVMARDLIADPIERATDEAIRGCHASPEAMADAPRAGTVRSDALSAGTKAADASVISAPIDNFPVPSALEPWNDQIVRVGQAFGYEDGWLRGFLRDHPTDVSLSYGAGCCASSGPPMSPDFLRADLDRLMGLGGLASVETPAVEARTAPDAADRLSAAPAHIDARVGALA